MVSDITLRFWDPEYLEILSRPEGLEMVWWQVLQGQPHWASEERSGVTALLPRLSSPLAATAVHFSPHESLQSEVAPCSDTSRHTNLGSDSGGVCVPAVMSQACVTSALPLSAFFITLANDLPQPWAFGSSHFPLDTCKFQGSILCAGGSEGELCAAHTTGPAQYGKYYISYRDLENHRQ